MTEKYDSTAETVKHILRIQELLHNVVRNLLDRADSHDRSKLSPAEKDVFDEFTPKLKNSTFGSEEYQGFLKSMGKALNHHYQHNKSHHPDAHPNGINNMTLLDMVEMIVDWKAASERHDDGDILKSIDYNKERFGMSDQLERLFKNTVAEMQWSKEIRRYLISLPFYRKTKDREGKDYWQKVLPFSENILKEFVEKFNIQVGDKRKECKVIGNNFDPFDYNDEWYLCCEAQGMHGFQWYFHAHYGMADRMRDWLMRKTSDMYPGLRVDEDDR